MLQQILSHLNATYSMTFDNIQLHRDMIGYVCLVFSGEDKYVLKLFRSEHTKQAIQSIEIMSYLDEAGFPTAHIVPTSSGMLYFYAEYKEERRIGVLYEYITGDEPDKCKDITNIGKQTGRLHNLMKQYNGSIYRHDKTFFVDRYINVLSEMKYPSVDKFKELGDSLWRRVEGCAKGFCHGDYHTGNMLFDAKGQFVLFDFDAAANAFSVYDIAVICDSTNYFELSDCEYEDTTRMLERFLKGYSDYITLTQEDINLVYDFIGIRHFEAQATIIESLGLSCVDQEFIDNQYEWLVKWDKLIRK